MSEKKPEDQRISAVPPFGLRMLPELRDRIEETARKNGRSINAEIVARLEQSFEASAPSETLHIVLDTNGFPISWHEIHEHLHAITRAGKFNPHSIQAHIVTPKMLSSSERQDETERLARAYRTAKPKKDKK